MNDGNDHDWHPALGYKPPRQVERDDYTRHSTPCMAA